MNEYLFIIIIALYDNVNYFVSTLSAYSDYEWHDIIRLAVYRQYNRAIPDSADCYKTGRLKKRYGVENILKMPGKNKHYNETHNAVLDAQDELKTMQLPGYGFQAMLEKSV